MSDPHWEYRLEVLTVTDGDDASRRAGALAGINDLGSDGWEVVGFAPSHAASRGLRVETDRFLVLLKRVRD